MWFCVEEREGGNRIEFWRDGGWRMADGGQGKARRASQRRQKVLSLERPKVGSSDLQRWTDWLAKAKGEGRGGRASERGVAQFGRAVGWVG